MSGAAHTLRLLVGVERRAALGLMRCLPERFPEDRVSVWRCQRCGHLAVTGADLGYEFWGELTGERCLEQKARAPQDVRLA